MNAVKHRGLETHILTHSSTHTQKEKVKQRKLFYRHLLKKINAADVLQLDNKLFLSQISATKILNFSNGRAHFIHYFVEAAY